MLDTSDPPRLADGAARQDPLMAVRQLTVGYQTAAGSVHLVQDASFEIDAGEVVCLVGESGSGKTLTARAMMGLLQRNRRMVVQGRVVFEGRDLNRMSERDLRQLRGRDIATIFQDPVASLDPVMSIGRQIAEAARRSGGATHTRVLELLAQVGISDPEHRIRQFPHELSGGMCQRVSMAVALAGQPKLLIADEPTTALDVTIQAQVLDLLRRLRDERGMSVVLITHDMGVAAQISDRILVMYAGSVVESGPTREFFAHPGHPYSAGLISAVPRMRARRTARLATIGGAVPEARNRPPGCPFHPRCPLAIDRCRSEPPPLTSVASQLVACHRAQEVQSAGVTPWKANPEQSATPVGHR